ncbi:Pre-mRNA-splicing factor [Mortierella sp. GBA43]|nr:Pre-mRNA-splicing factor [Mortierella sp. GBA43]
MSRPARRQVAKQKTLGPQPSLGNKGGELESKYNIYYDKWTGGGRQRNEKAQHRCDPAKDSGRTKGTMNPNAYFCVFFAKGCCPNGKTIFVGRIQPSPDMRAIVEKHFKAWGDIEYIKVLMEKGVAFVTYQSRLNTEFAKEAMMYQSLDHDEILNVRWAEEDPNPKVQAMNKRKAVEMVRQAIETNLPTDYKETQHLPGSEETEEQGSNKRSKQKVDHSSESTTDGSEAATPTLYLGADGQYYYDYGEYGYNHDTQQYDPARLGGYSGTINNLNATHSQATSSPSLQDRIKASLQSTAPALPSILPSTMTDTKKSEPKPTTSALSALAAYGSDSESE